MCRVLLNLQQETYNGDIAYIVAYQYKRKDSNRIYRQVI